MFADPNSLAAFFKKFMSFITALFKQTLSAPDDNDNSISFKLLKPPPTESGTLIFLDVFRINLLKLFVPYKAATLS